MNREDIEHMWKVASNNPNHDTNWHDPVVIRFAELVASSEREACAKVCAEDGVQAMDFTGGTFVGGYFAKKIIARGDS